MISIAGLLVQVAGAYFSNYYLLLIGRGIFGLGAESQNIWVATIISIWFYYGEMSFASA